ncbi:MAG: GNAT family N-acetyltransferase [Candidatus Wildermuthbacteria bacterium]|nr:GNAT family N-acetyltransferase [Candidatus Wildermuthbacteria bacterium]
MKSGVIAKLKIRRIHNLLNEDVEELHDESKKEGYNLIDKLINGFKSGENKFSKKGECLIVCEIDNKIVGICGLNIDPLNPRRGRIRRLYVLPPYRDKGVGRELVKELIHYSNKHFKSVSVNTGNLNVSEFYEELGFKKYDKENGITHLLINKQPNENRQEE